MRLIMSKKSILNIFLYNEIFPLFVIDCETFWLNLYALTFETPAVLTLIVLVQGGGRLYFVLSNSIGRNFLFISN